jgi:hypothetical protein
VPFEAQFSHALQGDVLKIWDLGLGPQSVTNDAENVLQKIEAWHQRSLVGYRIMYRDSLKRWDGIEWDGREVRFFPPGETQEQVAERKLRRVRPPRSHE